MTIPFIEGDIITVVKSVGYIGIFLIIFAESSLFFSFFLPGSSLIFTAGFLASQGFFNISFLFAVLALAAILGDSFGYWFGTKMGEKLFDKKDSRFFKRKHLEKTVVFYQKYGIQAIVIGRFIPIVRTFIPVLAGVGSMKYRTFLQYNIIGGIGWCGSVVFLGYFLGRSIPNVEHFLLPIVAVIILVSIIPIILELRGKKPIQ